MPIFPSPVRVPIQWRMWPWSLSGHGPAARSLSHIYFTRLSIYLISLVIVTISVWYGRAWSFLEREIIRLDLLHGDRLYCRISLRAILFVQRVTRRWRLWRFLSPINLALKLTWLGSLNSLGQLANHLCQHPVLFLESLAFPSQSINLEIEILVSLVLHVAALLYGL